MKLLLVVVVVFLGLSLLAEAQEEWDYPSWAACLIAKETRIEQCATSYEQCINDVTNLWMTWTDASEVCNCLTLYLQCLCAECTFFTDVFAQYGMALTDWCTPITWHYAFEGDPHFMGPKGLLTCDGTDFSNIYTTSKISVSGHATAMWPPRTGTAFDSITVAIGGKTFEHTLTSDFLAAGTTVPEGYFVSAHSVGVVSTAESVNVINWTKWLDLSIYGETDPNKGSGILFEGQCPDGTTASATTETFEECESLGEFKDACNYDISVTGDHGFANSTRLAMQQHAAAMGLINKVNTNSVTPAALPGVLLLIAALLLTTLVQLIA